MHSHTIKKNLIKSQLNILLKYETEESILAMSKKGDVFWAESLAE